MDYGPKGNFGRFEGKLKGAITPKPERPRPPNLVSMHFTSVSTCMNFLSQFYFLTPMDIVHGPKGNFGRFEGKLKGAITPKPEMPRPPKLVSMHFMSVSTCIIFLSQFHFLTPMDYSPWSEGKFLTVFEGKQKWDRISKTEDVMPTKIGVHAFEIYPYLHDFSERISFDSIF